MHLVKGPHTCCVLNGKNGAGLIEDNHTRHRSTPVSCNGEKNGDNNGRRRWLVTLYRYGLSAVQQHGCRRFGENVVRRWNPNAMLLRAPLESEYYATTSTRSTAAVVAKTPTTAVLLWSHQPMKYFVQVLLCLSQTEKRRPDGTCSNQSHPRRQQSRQKGC